MLAIVERLEPIYDTVLYEMSSLLKGAVERKEDGRPVIFGSALARANAVWAACAAHEHRFRRQLKTGLRWPSIGLLATFWTSISRRFGSCGPNGRRNRAHQSILQALETAIDGDDPLRRSRESCFGEGLIVGRYLPGLVHGHVCPCSRRPQLPEVRTELGWIPGLGYLDASYAAWFDSGLPAPSARDHGRLDDRSRMFCNHLAGFAVFGAIDPLENGWLDDFLTRTSVASDCIGSGALLHPARSRRPSEGVRLESVDQRYLGSAKRIRLRSTRKSRAPCVNGFWFWIRTMPRSWSSLDRPTPDVKEVCFTIGS